MRHPALLLLITCTLTARPDVAAIREDLAREKVRRTEEYLKATPTPPDELAAVNLLLEGYQELKRVPEMIPLLQRRYELLRKDPQANLQHLLERTAVPLAQAMSAQHRRVEAVEFLGKVKADFAAHPSAAQIATALDGVIKQIRPPQEGDAPALAVTDAVTGTAVKPLDFAGKYTQVEFWVTTCDICKAQKDTLEIAWRKHQEQGFRVVGINLNERKEDLLAFLAEQKLPWPNAWDPDPAHKVASRLNIDFIPTSLLIGPDGKIIALNLRGDALLKKLEELLPAK
jgi:AhpC/TSA family